MAENEKLEQTDQTACLRQAKSEKKAKKPGIFARDRQVAEGAEGRAEEGRVAHPQADRQQHP